MSQQSRRRDPYPWTWEIPVGVVLMIFVGAGLGVHLGRAVANVMAGLAGRSLDVASCSGVCPRYCVATPGRG